MSAHDYAWRGFRVQCFCGEWHEVLNSADAPASRKRPIELLEAWMQQHTCQRGEPA
jgi:hypothetical protein